MDVKTASRTIDLFEAFASRQTALTLAEIERILDAPASSCASLVKTLERRGYLYSVGDGRAIYPTRRLFDIASAVVAGDQIVQRLEPMLIDLRNQSQETVMLGTRYRDQVVYLSVVESLQMIRYSASAGERKPLHSSAIGKALLSRLSSDDFANTLARLPLDAVTGTTITDPKKLTAEIARTAQRGFARTNGEHVSDVMAIAKVLTCNGMDYGIAIAGPLPRMKQNEESHVAALDRCLATVVPTGI